MREIAVIKSGNREHSSQIQTDGSRNRRPAPTDPENRQATQVEKQKGNRADPFDFVRLGPDGRQIARPKIRIKPLRQGDEALSECC